MPPWKTSCCGRRRGPGIITGSLDLKAKLISDLRLFRLFWFSVHPRALSESSLKKLNADPCSALVPLFVVTRFPSRRQDTSRIGPCAAALDLHLFDTIGNRPHAGRGKKVGRGVDAVRARGCSESPHCRAPRKAQPDVAVDSSEHPGVVLATPQPFAPHSPRSPAPMVSETTALWGEHLRPGFDIDRLGRPSDLERASVRTTWLPATWIR